MRRAARVDDNQAEIVKALRMAGMTVQLLHQVGNGCPDLLVGWRQKFNILLEVKRGDGELNKQQTAWRTAWNGQIAVVRTPDEAVDAVLGAANQ